MILIVGGAGYIGSHTNQQLHSQGYSTLVYDNLVHGHREFVQWGEFIYGDLANVNLLDRVFSQHEIDAVFHFAAYAYVGESVKNPSKYYHNNVAHMLNLLDKMVEYGVPHIVFSSSCATYGESESMPITEACPQNPVNPYGRSKHMVEQILEDYHRAYGINYCALRYFNAAGATPEGMIGEWHDPETHLIPLILETAMGKREIVYIYGDDYPTEDGTCVRDYIHVSDLADAHIRALAYMRKRNVSDCFNLANGQGYSVKEIIETARRITGKEISVRVKARRPGDPAVLVGSAEKAKRALGWKPCHGLEEIMRTAWRWHQKR